MEANRFEEFQREIYRNWAEHFRCPTVTFQQGGVTLLPEDRYTGKKLIVLWHIGDHTFAEFDPAYAQVLERVLSGSPGTATLTGDDLKHIWGAGQIAELDIGLVHNLYPPDLPPQTVPPPFAMRRLTPADADAMQSLHEANTPEDVDEGYVEVTHEIAYGCFAGDQLAAAASGYRRTGFMDIGVLTHPRYRRKGLGKAAVAALCAWSIEQGFIAQYRCNAANTGSRNLARSLGFRLFFRSEGVWLASSQIM